MHDLLKTTLVIFLGISILLVSSECYSGPSDMDLGAPTDFSDRAFPSPFPSSNSEIMLDMACDTRNKNSVNEALKKLIIALFGNDISKNLEKYVQNLSIEDKNLEYFKYIRKAFKEKTK